LSRAADRFGRVARVVEGEGAVFNTKERAPILMLFEVRRVARCAEGVTVCGGCHGVRSGAESVRSV
jgi:hypothetical protein